jgi:hypothetical protein
MHIAPTAVKGTGVDVGHEFDASPLI